MDPRINVPVKGEQLAKIRRAARKVGLCLATFVRVAALREADAALAKKERTQ